MQSNVCILRASIFAVLVSSALPSKTGNYPANKPELASSEGSPSRLATARSLLRPRPQEISVVSNGLNHLERTARLLPREASIVIPESYNVDNGSQVVYGIPPEAISDNGEIPLTISTSFNGTKKQVTLSPDAAPSMPKASGTPLKNTTNAPSKTTVSAEKSLNHSVGGVADAGAPSSQLLLSVQTAGSPYSAPNISSLESGANVTGNQSTVLITNTHEIELVIIAERPPESAPLLPPSTELTPLPEVSDPPSRRFPSGMLYQNGSYMGARRPLPERYPTHHYWAVYLTLTLLTLSVLAICLVCCTPQGRRDMSIQQPKPAQYGHELPPYSYPFSYDMRQAEAQETARLEPASS